MTSLKTSIKTITYLSDIGCLEIQGASLQVMPLNSLRISLADYVQLSLQAGFIQRPAIRHPYHHVKG